MYKIHTETLFVGKEIIFLPVCHSTNDVLSDKVKSESAFEGTVVITSHQTAGKGQMGNRWEAEPGQNLTFSVLFHPSFLPIQKQFFLAVFTSLALADVLDQYISDVSIKWPNDIYIKDKKIGGILIENTMKGEVIDCSISGIGLNVNQKQFEEKKAVSLAMVTQTPVDLEKLLAHILEALEHYYLLLKAAKYDLLKTAYLHRLYRYQEYHLFEINQQRVKGMIVGVNEEGKLAVDVGGKVYYFGMKEIKFL